VGALALVHGVLACGGPQRVGAGRALASEGAIVIPGEADAGLDAALEIRAEHAGDGGPGVAISADAGVASGELAWLIAHIGDDPDRVHSADSPNVRALAARGAEGVRAVAPLLRRGDAGRARFARRVLERVMARACGSRDRLRLQRLALWLELGRVPEDALNDAGIVVWTLPDEHAWAPEGLARLLAWADGELLCEPAAIAARIPDGGARAARSDAGARMAFDATVDESRLRPRVDAGGGS
jgi:hypothetical protein